MIGHWVVVEGSRGARETLICSTIRTGGALTLAGYTGPIRSKVVGGAGVVAYPTQQRRIIVAGSAGRSTDGTFRARSSAESTSSSRIVVGMGGTGSIASALKYKIGGGTGKAY